MPHPTDTQSATIAEVLRRLRGRQRLRNCVRGAAHGALVGAVTGAALLAVVWLAAYAGWTAMPERFMIAAWALAAIPIAMIGGLLIGALLRVDDLAVARALDRCASSDDRFASAVSLASHHRAERVRLIAEDALSRVGGLSANRAIPLSTPRTMRWALVPVMVALALLIIAPSTELEAAAPTPNEISDDQWTELHKEFAEELAQLPKPETEKEQELRKEFESLAQMLEKKPAKREALREIARLSDRVEQHKKSLSTRDVNMRNAAQAMARSEALKQFASLLKQGDYRKAATELQAMSQQLTENQLSPNAQEFESMAADLEQLAQEVSQQPELQESCQQCANAANAMNRDELAQAMKRFAEQLQKNADQMRQCDSCNQQQSLLDMLKRRMNQCSQCQGCKSGCSQCQGNGLCQGNKPGNKPGNGAGKGGLKAGWGSAANWDGGELGANAENRQGEVANPLESSGEQSSFRIVSPDERATSGMTYEELYAEFVQKAEADLELESVPVAQREFLRRYFNAIRPQESATSSESDDH